MKVLVTGAAGHVGGNLVRLLLEHRVDVRALVREDARALQGLPVEQVQGDVRDPDSLAAAFKDVEVVFHLAAVISILGDRGGLVRATNVDGVRHVAQAARQARVRRMIHFSSCHAFDLDFPDGPITEDTPRAKPSDPTYNRSKWAGEQALQEEIRQGLDAVILNPAGVIGPCDFKPSRMGRLFLDLAHGRLPATIGGGFDFVDVRDLVRTAWAALEKGRTGENYLVSNRWISIPELARLAAGCTGRAAPRWASPMWAARLGAPFMDAWGHLTGGEPLYTMESLHALRANPEMSSEKARQQLGHTTRAMDESVADVHQWFRSQGLLPEAA